MSASPIRLATRDDREVMRALYAEFKHEYRHYDPAVEPNLAEPLQDDWFEKPEDLYPFVIQHEGADVGFALILGRRYTEAIGHDTDWYVYDYYVRPEARGTGVAREAAWAIFERCPGTWATKVRDANERSLGFTKHALARYRDTLTVTRCDDEPEALFRFTAPG